MIRDFFGGGLEQGQICLFLGRVARPWGSLQTPWRKQSTLQGSRRTRSGRIVMWYAFLLDFGVFHVIKSHVWGICVRLSSRHVWHVLKVIPELG